jgi:hypothetical protein
MKKLLGVTLGVLTAIGGVALAIELGTGLNYLLFVPLVGVL